jgi:hypothetical protein
VIELTEDESEDASEDVSLRFGTALATTSPAMVGAHTIVWVTLPRTAVIGIGGEVPLAAVKSCAGSASWLGGIFVFGNA